MYNALRRNKPEFVQLLLENGVVMTYFLTTVKLEDLYESVSDFYKMVLLVIIFPYLYFLLSSDRQIYMNRFLAMRLYLQLL